MKKKALFLLFIVSLLHIGTKVLSQNKTVEQQERYISGRISDAEDGSPIPGASVFFTNTTVGITTDIEGRYRLRIPGEGSYQLSVSHAGYQLAFKDIEPGKNSVTFDAALQIRELEDVTVSAKVKFRQTDINLFWNTILGKSPSRKTIQATNPESVFYYYNPKTRILKVTCHEPLQIVNNETGYHIQYVLGNFTHDYNTGVSDWSSQYVFTELEPANPKQKNSWTKKREEVYKVSLTKFIRSLYNNTLSDNGFVLADFRLKPDPSTPFLLSVLTPENILSTVTTGNSKTLNLSDRQILLVCYGRPVTKEDVEMLERSPHVSGQIGYFAGRPVTGKRLDNQGLYRNLLQGASIRIFSDGTYANRLRLTPVNSSETLLGLSLCLPLEYLPDDESISSTDAIAGNLNDFDSIARLFNKQLSVLPQEKVHLHTDRNYYVPGEKIWFKAYVADAADFRYPTDSRYVYAELISPTDSLMSRVMVRREEGIFYGYIPIPLTVPEGNYTLRAYTRYMENTGDDYFFKKNIRIGNLLSVKEKETKDKKTKDIPAKSDFDVSFFPEGGNTVEGVFCKVAFKALNSDGTSASISGNIIDENGSVVTTAESFHAGMGAFGFIPEPGKKYRLQCRNGNNLEKQFDLPPANPDALALAVVRMNPDKRIAVEVRKSKNTPDVPCYLLFQCRGKALYFSALNDLSKITVFNKEDLPAGIIHMILFDKQMHPLSERLVFNKNNISEPVGFQTDKAVYAIRDKVVATINTGLFKEDPEEASLSVAVTDDRDISPDSATTILSTMLLASELKGYIENPAYYLRDDIQAETALDYLMMTHGWRRYDVPEVVKGNNTIPGIPYQTSFVFTGNVKNLNLLRTRPVAGSEISMVAGRDILSTTTDENGRFTFQDFEYPDSTRYFIQALTGKGSNRVELVLDKETFPKPIHAIQSADVDNLILKEKSKIEPETNAFISKAEQRSKYDPSMRVIPLQEVTVTAKKIERKNEPRLDFWANESSDVTLRRKEIERFRPRLVSDLLRHVAGVQVYENGAISIHQGGLPLVLIDGVPLEWDKDVFSNHDPSIAAQFSPVEAVSAYAIESIDIFKGPSASVFGARGSEGAISITTKKGGGINPVGQDFNYTIYTPLGYQKPVEFYSPKYETLQAKQSSIPDLRTTIFWKPDIVISNDHKEAGFDFYTSDFPTTYSVVIEGLTSDGKIIRQVEKIRVE